MRAIWSSSLAAVALAPPARPCIPHAPPLAGPGRCGGVAVRRCEQLTPGSWAESACWLSQKGSTDGGELTYMAAGCWDRLLRGLAGTYWPHTGCDRNIGSSCMQLRAVKHVSLQACVTQLLVRTESTNRNAGSSVRAAKACSSSILPVKHMQYS